MTNYSGGAMENGLKQILYTGKLEGGYGNNPGETFQGHEVGQQS